KPSPGCHGISHTRWATYGPASDRNAHPHLSTDGSIAVVHNGVIENYSILKRQLQSEGVTFHSDTDTEVIAHLIEQHYHGDRVDATIHSIDWDPGDADKGDFEHHMLKEIYEQPEALENAMRGRLSDEDASAHFGGLNLDARQLRRAERFIFTACGTSYHAALVGEYLFEELARIPVEVEYASEFRYRNPPMERNTIVLTITQSGETADTLAALRESKRKGHHTLSLCNVVGSTIAREADGGVYLHAGPEIGVASTKAFSNQVAVLSMLALYMGRIRHQSSIQGLRMLKELRALPDIVRRALECNDQVQEIARRYYQVSNML